MRTRSLLPSGRKLKIWPKKGQTAAAKRNPFRRYTVRKGDSLSAIASRFKVSVADLRKWNATQLGRYIRPGQTLKIRRSPTG